MLVATAVPAKKTFPVKKAFPDVYLPLPPSPFVTFASLSLFIFAFQARKAQDPLRKLFIELYLNKYLNKYPMYSSSQQVSNIDKRTSCPRKQEKSNNNRLRGYRQKKRYGPCMENPIPQTAP